MVPYLCSIPIALCLVSGWCLREGKGALEPGEAGQVAPNSSADVGMVHRSLVKHLHGEVTVTAPHPILEHIHGQVLVQLSLVELVIEGELRGVLIHHEYTAANSHGYICGLDNSQNTRKKFDYSKTSP